MRSSLERRRESLIHCPPLLDRGEESLALCLPRWREEGGLARCLPRDYHYYYHYHDYYYYYYYNDHYCYYYYYYYHCYCYYYCYY